MRPVLYFDPATVTPVTRKLKGVLAIMIYHCHHQVAVFRDCFERASEAPHAVLVERLWKYRFDLTQSKRARRARGRAFGNFYFEQETEATGSVSRRRRYATRRIITLTVAFLLS